MSVKICHFTPGRMRVRVPSWRHRAYRAGELARWLGTAAFIDRVEVRPASGSVIVHCRPTVSRHALRGLVLGWRPGPLPAPAAGTATAAAAAGSPCRLHPVTAPEVSERHGACRLDCRNCRPDRRPESLFSQVAGVALLTGYVVGVFIRETFFGVVVSGAAVSVTAAVVLAGALPLFRHAWADLKSGRHASLFPFLAGTCALAVLLGEALTALEVVWILRIGMLLEDYVARRSHRAIREIVTLAAKNTFILVDGVEVEIPVEQVAAGNVVVCHTGEKIPVDGQVVRGEALVDESPITGRAVPEEKCAGSRTFAGTIVSHGVLFIRAERVGDDTYLCRVLHLVEESLDNRAPAETRADVLANRLMRIGAITVAGTWLLTWSARRAFTVLLVLACPCATVLAASTAVAAALANAARNHILVKGGLYLEQIGTADCFCFDKTGTLTADSPRLVDIFPRTPRQNPDRILELAAAAEMHNQHPLARALLAAARERGLEPPAHAVCEFVLGRGVRAQVGDDIILVGNENLMHDEGVDCTYYRNTARAQIECGNTLVYVARNNRLQGLIAIANTVRPGAEAVLRWLRRDGVEHLYLVTGDHEPVAREMSARFGFDDHHSELLPEDKADYIDQLQRDGRRTVMVGDGVNDALALTRAGIGIAMGAGGAEVAIEAADIALVDSDLERLVRLRQLSRQTLAVIEQNHLLAMSTNVGGVIFGAAGLLTPLMAGALHIVHTLGILVNSTRLLGWEAPGLPAGAAVTISTEAVIGAATEVASEAATEVATEPAPEAAPEAAPAAAPAAAPEAATEAATAAAADATTVAAVRR
ncbi:MAG: cation-translocating P-type ATPase [Deltaproteobacteria bacterium]|nr:cation-translocating P-type ATPase [Candidatus Anaeroferrophillacea bacterium]